MSTTNPDRKESILKSLAIAGLLALTIAIAWLAVQIVHIFPAALPSLVRSANSVYNYNPLKTHELKLITAETTVTAGEPFTVSWAQSAASGTYVFSFECTPDTRLDLTAEDKTFTDLTCAEKYDIGTVDSIELQATTNTNQLSPLTYTVSFYRPHSETPAASQSVTVTVIDATLADTTTPRTQNPEPETVLTVEPATTTSPIASPEPTPEISQPVAETPQPPTQTETTVYTYITPVSNPTGTPDLTVGFLGVGQLTGNGFVSTRTLRTSEPAAFQFSVQNIGSRTSETWSYSVKLPNGTTYTSTEENPLKPNERAVLTLSFPAYTETDSTATFEIKISTAQDSLKSNDVITRTVSVQ